MAAPDRAEWDEGNAALRAGIQDGCVIALGNIEVVLHRRDRRDGARFGEMCFVDVAESEVTDQALLAQPSEGLEGPPRDAPCGTPIPLPMRKYTRSRRSRPSVLRLSSTRARRSAVGASDEPLGPKTGPDLGSNDETAWVRVERLADEEKTRTTPSLLR